MKVFITIVDGIDRIIRILVVVMFAISLAAIVCSVICRSLLFISVPWSEEVAKYLTVYIVYWAAGLAARYGKLTRLTAATDALHLGPRGKKMLNWCVGLISVGFYILVGYAAIKSMHLASIQVSPALKMPMWIPYFGIPVGCVLLILNTLASLLDPRDMRAMKGGVAE